MMASQSSKMAGDQRTLLIIEDEKDTALTLADIFEVEGLTVHVALNGEAGIEIVQQAQPDVVLCDIGLPGMDGFAVARALRNGVGFTGTLVAFTGYVDPGVQQRCKLAGFDHHLAKPAQVEQIIEIVLSARTRVTASK